MPVNYKEKYARLSNLRQEMLSYNLSDEQILNSHCSFVVRFCIPLNIKTARIISLRMQIVGSLPTFVEYII